MKYNIDEILNKMSKDKNDDYIVYWEDANGNEHYHEDYYLDGKTALKLFEAKRLDCKVRAVELLYNPQEDEELEDRIILRQIVKSVIDLGIMGMKVYV